MEQVESLPEFVTTMDDVIVDWCEDIVIPDDQVPIKRKAS